MGDEQYLVQQIVSTVEETYLADILNYMTSTINGTVADVLTHLQVHLMPHELLDRKDIVKKTTYHLHDPITTLFSAIVQK